ncbi:right-handed parallel beta-helix repeat-containing protein [Aestuariivivens sediminicola]|uniref:right-handed parallel beta-helix repeat-containing protein n=1 Tax=Aestuariivivens sediminicola TaxID=2913560 RepID=UPI001F57037B|nr:right-handed parallel beta-helix repeat-containing protein [Aestuariivivens sediminicola]
MMRFCGVVLLLMSLSFNGYSQFEPAPSFFRTARAAPLVELNTTQTIVVSDYGANADDGMDDIAGITAAVNAAVSLATLQNPVRLVFENGTYDLMPAGGTHALSMTDAQGVLWDGQGALFLIHNPVVGFLSLLRCTNTIIQDLSVDYATLPFTQGKITNIDTANGFFDFVVDEGFPLPVESHFTNAPQRWGMFKNSKGGIKEGTRNLIPHNRYFELIAPRTYRYGNQSSTNLSNAEVGDYFVHIARYNGSTLILNDGGKNLTYLNVTGYTSPAGCFNARNSEEWHIINCNIMLKAGRVNSSNADAIHVNGGKIGPWVENSLFEGFADDCMNLKYHKRQILEVHSSTEITVRFLTEVNDIMEFFNPRDGVFLGSATVTHVQNLGSNQYRLTLSSPINITNVDASDHQLTDKAYIETKSNESFIFRNNIVRNSRRYGILIQSKYALIENNLFQNLSSSGIRIENGVDWGEGFRADNIEIKNNRFENCGYDTSFISGNNAAAIAVDFAKLGTPCSLSSIWCGTETTDWRAHSNIRIMDNTILYNKRGLYLKNIEGLTLTNNFICHRDEDITLGTTETPEPQTILNCGNIYTEDYQYTLPEPSIHFWLNEDPDAEEVTNSGTDTGITMAINTNGGEIIQGFVDDDIGYAFKINTDNNGALSLTNTNDGSPFPGPVQGAARTYSFWVKPEQLLFQTLLYSGGPTAGEVFSLQMQTNGILRLVDNNQNIVRMEDMPLDIGEWNHIAVTVPENNTLFSAQFYKNGIPSDETYSGNDMLINTADNRVDFFPRFNGLVSDIRYFDYKLCGSDVERIYNDRQTTLSTYQTEQRKSKDIIVYPTFVSDILYFNKPIHSIKLFDLLGKMLLSKQSSHFTELRVSQLPAGFYMVQINNMQTEKIYKK